MVWLELARIRSDLLHLHSSKGTATLHKTHPYYFAKLIIMTIAVNLELCQTQMNFKNMGAPVLTMSHDQVSIMWPMCDANQVAMPPLLQARRPCTHSCPCTPSSSATIPARTRSRRSSSSAAQTTSAAASTGWFLYKHIDNPFVNSSQWRPVKRRKLLIIIMHNVIMGQS